MCLSFDTSPGSAVNLSVTIGLPSEINFTSLLFSPQADKIRYKLTIKRVFLMIKTIK